MQTHEFPYLQTIIIPLDLLRHKLPALFEEFCVAGVIHFPDVVWDTVHRKVAFEFIEVGD